MTHLIVRAAALLLMIPAAAPVPAAPIVSAISFRGPAWISIEHPVNPFDATTKNAFLVVHAYHHGTAIDFPVTGTAEGIVSGTRRTVSLEFTKTSRPGVYALRNQWPKDGVWTLVISVTQEKNDVATAVVELAPNGSVASVNVPAKMQDGWMIPQHVAITDIEAGLRSRSSALARR